MMNFSSLPAEHGNHDACFSEEHMKARELHLIFNAVTHFSVSLEVNFVCSIWYLSVLLNSRLEPREMLCRNTCIHFSA